MGWPKGKPRKGHINQDGTEHAGKGEKIRAIRKNPEKYKAIIAIPKVDRVEKSVAVTVMPTASGSEVIHGGTSRPIIEPCPKCWYAYADGGYCPECGETAWRGPERTRIRVAV